MEHDKVQDSVLSRIISLVTDDIQLISAYKSGDTAAFETLYERYFKAVYGAVYMRTHHRQTTEDIVSQTWLQALDKLHTFNAAKGSFAGWIHQIARNVVIDHFRSLRPNDNLDDIWDLASDDNVPRDVSTTLKVQHVQASLAKLPAKQRDVILFRVWYGYSFADIADMLGTTEAACKMSYRRGIDAVRTLLVLVLLFFSFFHGFAS